MNYSLNIPSEPNRAWTIRILGYDVFTIKQNLKSEFDTYSEKIDTLTKDKAIEILKNIKWEADLKAFFTHPAVLIPASALVLIAGLVTVSIFAPAIAASSAVLAVALTIFGYALQFFGGFVLGGAIKFTLFEDILLPISHGFSIMSTKAKELINQLEPQNSDVKLTTLSSTY